MKSGFAVIIGRSNVGKSTLLNALIGTKIAITTPKPQTTRKPIQGVLHAPEGQVVFVDTPGIMQKARDPLTKKLNVFAEKSLRDIDVIVYVADPTRSIGSEEKNVLQIIKKFPQPKLLVINKIDDKKSEAHIDFYRDLLEDHFDAMVEVSATRGSNVDLIKKWIFEHLPEGEPFYGEMDLSNMSREEQLAEIIREKLFLRLREEVPYSIHVKVHDIDFRPDGTMYVRADILTTDERYKGMIIGQRGQGLKEIGQSARRELQTITDAKVYLDLHVEVDPHWIERFE